MLLIALILLPFVIWQTMKRRKMAAASAAWPSVPGVITSAGTAKVVFRTQPRVAYSYEKDGKSYSGKLISVANVVPKNEIEAVLQRYSVGQAVTVYYSPENPATAVLETGGEKQFSAAIGYYIFLFVFLIALQFLLVAVRHWSASEEEKKAPTYDDVAAGSPAPIPDSQTTDQNIRDQAEKGDATEQFTVGMWYLAGMEGTAKDPVEAAKWFRKSAAQGNPNAEAMLGAIYAKGLGVEKDLVQAVAWYQKAAAQGQPMACTSLGFASEKGLGGMPQDRDKAIEWYKKAGNVPQAKAALARLGAN